MVYGFNGLEEYGPMMTRELGYISCRVSGSQDYILQLHHQSSQSWENYFCIDMKVHVNAVYIIFHFFVTGPHVFLLKDNKQSSPKPSFQS